MGKIKVRELLNILLVVEAKRDVLTTVLGIEESQADREGHAQSLRKAIFAQMVITRLLNKLPDDLTIEISEGESAIINSFLTGE